MQNEATSKVANNKFLGTDKLQEQMGKPKTYKFINFSDKLTELLADVICVILEEESWPGADLREQWQLVQWREKSLAQKNRKLILLLTQ